MEQISNVSKLFREMAIISVWCHNTLMKHGHKSFLNVQYFINNEQQHTDILSSFKNELNIRRQISRLILAFLSTKIVVAQFLLKMCYKRDEMDD